MPLQKSTHEAAVDIPAIPATVQPGETINWPDPIAGFVVIDTVPPMSSERSPHPSKRKSLSPLQPAEEVTS